MRTQPNQASYKPIHLSKLMALIALIVAFILPFLLIKMFPHKNKSIVTKIPPLQSVFIDKNSTSPSHNTLAKLPSLSPISESLTSLQLKDLKTTISSDEDNKKAWIIIKIREKDTLAKIFNRLGLDSKTLQNILLEMKTQTNILSKLKPNQELQFLIKNHFLEKMIIPLSNTQFITLTYENGHYLSKINTLNLQTQSHYISARINSSLHKTAKSQNIPYKLIKQMTDIFMWEIDFTKDIRIGDKFTIIYEAFYIENKLINIGDILSVSYKNRNKTFQAVRHINKIGQAEYYTPEGHGLKKAFSRYPLRFTHISSVFSLSRYHPILHYKRAHKGVDLAASIGTPIQSTGDGRIEIIGRKHAYGNMIKIKHNSTYSTLYGHMLKFQKGLKKGDFVKRGQIIGYVGQTGLASGPHCHYEFHVNNQPKNPTTIDLPQTPSIKGEELEKFKINTPLLLAQLNNYSVTDNN